MDFEDWKHAWREQPAPAARPAAAIVDEVRTAARAFSRQILWRDLREGLVAVGLSLYFGHRIATGKTPSNETGLLFLAALLPLVIPAFLVINRLRRRRATPAATDAVVTHLDHALDDLRHQAWLLRHVVWWYLLPLASSIALFEAHAFRHSSVPTVIGIVQLGIVAFATGALYVWIYRLNQRAISVHLRPRMDALEVQRQEWTATDTNPDPSA